MKLNEQYTTDIMLFNHDFLIPLPLNLVKENVKTNITDL